MMLTVIAMTAPIVLTNSTTIRQNGKDTESRKIEEEIEGEADKETGELEDGRGEEEDEEGQSGAIGVL